MCCPMGILMKTEIHFVPVDPQARKESLALLQRLMLQGARRLSEPTSHSITLSESASLINSAQPSPMEPFHV